MADDDTKQLTGRQEAAALALACGQTIAAAATTAGTVERTLYKWRLLPEFKSRVRELRSAMVDQAAGKLADRLLAFTDRLIELAASQNESIALGAVKCGFEMTLRVREMVNLTEDMEELKRMFQADQQARGVQPR